MSRHEILKKPFILLLQHYNGMVIFVKALLLPNQEKIKK